MNSDRILMSMVFCVVGVTAVPAASLTNAGYWASIPGGNTADTNAASCPTNCGAVAYDYAIMKCEMTATQYYEFDAGHTNGPANEPVRFVAFSNAMACADWLTTNVPVYFTNNYYVVYTNGVTNYWTNTFDPFTNYLSGAYTNSTLTTLPAHVVFTNWTNYAHLFPNPTNDDQSVSDIISGGWLKQQDVTNHVYLIPTEDEWYKAAYGTNAIPYRYNIYPNGNLTVPTTNEFNYGGWSNDICVVGCRAGVSSYGACDMGGNVWEWIEPNTNSPAIPPGMALIRGGSYFSHAPWDLGVWTREYHAAANAVAGIGFRLIRIPQP